MTRFARYKPMPVPAGTFCLAVLPLKLRWNISSFSSALIGMPALLTEITSASPNFCTGTRSALMTILDLSSEYLTAFSRRFERAWAIRFFTICTFLRLQDSLKNVFIYHDCFFVFCSLRLKVVCKVDTQSQHVYRLGSFAELSQFEV